MDKIKTAYYKTRIAYCNVQIARAQSNSCFQDVDPLEKEDSHKARRLVKGLIVESESIHMNLDSNAYLLAFWLNTKIEYEKKINLLKVL